MLHLYAETKLGMMGAIGPSENSPKRIRKNLNKKDYLRQLFHSLQDSNL